MSTAAVATVVATLSHAVRATMSLNLQLANGATTAYIGNDQTNTDIAVQVWATVTGSSAITPVPAGGTFASDPQITTGGNFDGLRFAYYNILNSNSTNTYVAGGIDTVNVPTLNPYLKLNALGSQVGKVQNIVGGVSVGSTTSLADVAKPRSAANYGVFDNQSYYNSTSGLYQQLGNDGINISASGNTSSFLLETVYFKPTAYTALNQTTFSLSLPPSALLTTLAAANWYENTTNQNAAVASAVTTPTVGTSVTIQDTLAGDANLDGRVSSTDFATLRANFGTGTKWSQGDFNADGRVSSADFAALRANFGLTAAAVAASAPSLVKASALATQASAASQISLVVNTTTGDTQLSLSNFSLEQYEIYSKGGQLIASNLKSMQSQGYAGFVTTNTTVGNTNTDISEESGTPTGALTAIIDLGNIFNTMYAAAGTRDLDFSGTDGSNASFDVPVTYVTSASPEPTSLALLGLGVGGLLGRRRRR